MHQNGSVPSATNDIFNNQHNKLSQLPNLENKSFKQRNALKKRLKKKIKPIQILINIPQTQWQSSVVKGKLQRGEMANGRVGGRERERERENIRMRRKKKKGLSF